MARRYSSGHLPLSGDWLGNGVGRGVERQYRGRVFSFQGQTMSVRGLGAAISSATDSANLPVLLAATLVMSLIVVTVNRTVWQRLYRLAATRYKLET